MVTAGNIWALVDDPVAGGVVKDNFPSLFIYKNVVFETDVGKKRISAQLGKVADN